ncbi:hypothetical protein GCM10027451_32590 [Geodermatophilus aquaeductus]|uniref:DNA-binding beta-propeller fold protein YncE n=1 Tax=Geodermatophilus aquaeductus TaxID=1564161 RepID=A0A521F1E8_9ACTN|nr:hypothetical protein [Geodermatophilus aquaeductus]SMO89270.1 hypothetical protein SAMN06273567_106178 [Geodermatophilus aquaeductus]
MPARRAALAVVAMVAAGCTGGNEEAPPPREFTELAGTVDLDAVAPGGVDVLGLEPTGDGALVLLGGTADPAVGYLATLTADGLGEVRRIDGVGTELLVADDGTALVVGPDRITTVPTDGDPTVTEVVLKELAAAALSPDGTRLYAATPGRLVGLDPRTGETTAETDLGEGLTVAELEAGPDGPVALMSDARAADLADVAVLGTWDEDLRQPGTVELAPDRPASIPSALRLADDGTAVVTLTAGSGDDPFRVVVVRDGEVTASHAVPGTDRIPADLAVSPDGRVAYLPVAGFEVESGVITLDLAGGEQLGTARLCEGQGTFGRVALSGDRLTVVGSCIGSEAASTTAFLVG